MKHENSLTASAISIALLYAASSAAVAQPSTESSAATPADAAAPASYASIPVHVDTTEDAPVTSPADTRSNKIEEVMVTARRTAENMQDVPVSVSAMSAADLQRDKIGTAQDLQGRVPSLVISGTGQARNNESPALRGQGGQFGSSPGVVIYFAQVPLPADAVTNNQGGPGKFLDLGNLQVLKGSQGTLFGRNTTGGAFLLEPNKPAPDFSASLRAGLGNYDGRSYEGVINQPLVDDTLLTRFAAQYFSRGGFTRDVVTGKDYDSKDYWTVRGGLTWKPTDDVENYLLSYYTHSNDNGTGTVIKQINRDGFNQAIASGATPEQLAPIIAALPSTSGAGVGTGCQLIDVYASSTNCGQDILDAQAARGNRKVSLSDSPTDQINTGSVIDNFSYNLTDDLTLRNIASYSVFKHHYRLDIDGSSAEFVDFNNPRNLPDGDVKTETEEAQVQGKAFGSALKYVGGGYYEHTYAFGNITGSELLFNESKQFYTQRKSSFAPFTQGTYDLGELTDTLSGLSLTAGARYTFDKTEGFATFDQYVKGPGATGDATKTDISSLEHAGTTKSSALTYTVGLDYKIDTTLLFGKVSRGYKTGGFSTLAVNPAFYTFKPEYVLNYEIGEKSDFEVFDLPVRLNSAIYYTDYTNQQRAFTDSYSDPIKPSVEPEIGTATINVGRAYVAGFESDATIRLTRDLTLIGTYGYGRGAYKEFTAPYGGVTEQKDCSGQQRTRGDTLELSCIPFEIPRETYSVSARYLLPLDPSYGEVETSATYTYTASRYTAQTTIPGDEPGARLPSFALLNASLSWSQIFGSDMDFQLYGTNLTNRMYPINNSNQWHLTYFQSYVYAEPRIFGLNLSYRWGK